MQRSRTHLLTVCLPALLAVCSPLATPNSLLAAGANPPLIRGRVILDLNGNGQLDTGEQGLPGVAVTDGVQFVTTGADGTYELTLADDPVIPVRASRVVSICWPTGTWPSSQWYRRLADLPAGVPLNFALRKDEQRLPFIFAQGSDPHDGLSGGSTREFRSEIARMGNATAGNPVKFCIFTGDLGYASFEGADAEFTGIRDYTRSFPVPMFHTVGNHDVVGIHSTQWQKPTELAGNGTFTKYLGPVRWSFDYAGVHFVGLDWMKIVDGKLELGTPDVAAAWLDKDLSRLKPGSRILFFSHCVDGNDRNFYEVAVKHKIELILAGHSHRNLDISHRGIKALTVMNLRGPYRLPVVTGQGVEIVNRCVGCKDANYHSKSCALYRAYSSTHAAGSGSALKLSDVAIEHVPRNIGQLGPGNAEILVIVESGKCKRCGLRLTPGQGSGAAMNAVGTQPLEIALADNGITAGNVRTPLVRRPDQETYDLRIYLENGKASIYANGRVQFDVPFTPKGVCQISGFAEGGSATFRHLDAW